MARPRRCFSEQPIPSDGGSLVIHGPEAHHLLHVLRVKPGEPFSLFDGTGLEFAGEVSRCGRTEVEFTAQGGIQANRERAFPLVLGVPLPKGDRTRWLVEKLTELGVTKIVPLLTQHAEKRSKADSAEKIKRWVIEASKQCGRNRLMQITDVCTWQQWLGSPGNEVANRMVAHPSGTPLAEIACAEQQPTYVCVGPEAGLTEQEVIQAKDAGWSIASLGPRILRIETAAMLLAVESECRV